MAEARQLLAGCRGSAGASRKVREGAHAFRKFNGVAALIANEAELSLGVPRTAKPTLAYCSGLSSVVVHERNVSRSRAQAADRAIVAGEAVVEGALVLVHAPCADLNVAVGGGAARVEEVLDDLPIGAACREAPLREFMHRVHPRRKVAVASVARPPALGTCQRVRLSLVLAVFGANERNRVVICTFTRASARRALFGVVTHLSSKGGDGCGRAAKLVVEVVEHHRVCYSPVCITLYHSLKAVLRADTQLLHWDMGTCMHVRTANRLGLCLGV